MKTQFPSTVQYRNWTIGFAESVISLEKRHRGAYDVRFRDPAFALLNDWSRSFDYGKDPIRMAHHISSLKPATQAHETLGLQLFGQTSEERKHLGQRLLRLATMRRIAPLNPVLAVAPWTVEVMQIGAWWTYMTDTSEITALDRSLENYRSALMAALHKGHYLQFQSICLTIYRVNEGSKDVLLADLYHLLARDNPAKMVMLETFSQEDPQITRRWIEQDITELRSWWDKLDGLGRLRYRTFYRQYRRHLRQFQSRPTGNDA